MKAVGAKLPRYDGIGHVTGRTTYVDDVRASGTLQAKVLRSPHHHASIVNLDTSRAEKLRGVRAVITHKDVPRNVVGLLEPQGVPADEPQLAQDVVRYKGQPIVAVAAEDVDTAMEALDLIDVEYAERPGLFDIRLALEPDAPQAHEWGNVYPHFGPYNHRRVRKGDIDWAFDAADAIVSGVYRPAAIEHVPLETQVALAIPEPDGRLTIHSCTQAMYFTLSIVATHLQLPMNRIKLVGGTVGGGFGGKVDSAADTIAALLALRTQRPVKWRWTREEEFMVSSTRAAWHIELSDAVSSDGWILGRRMTTLHDSGAYARMSPYGLTKHAFHHTGAYTIPNLKFDGFVVFTNRVPTTAMRGFGVTSVSMATETHMTRIAEVLGLSPWEIRLKNANRIGDTTGNLVAMQDPSTVTVTQAAAERIGLELAPEYRSMTSDRRTGDLLPDHLVAQQAPPGAHVLSREAAGNGRGGR